jgi:cytochrome oxidase Cu insertion factor (SCO1/SenC/PrrC family)
VIRGVAAALGLGLLAIAARAGAHEAAAAAPLAFALPEPGSYELPAIARVPDFELLDERGAAVRLLGLAADQVAIVSFVYTQCPDGQGCPLALAALQGIDRALARDPALARRVRLATVSFDPVRDTPERMAALRGRLHPAADWRFLTAASPSAVAPVLAAFGQDALPLVDARGAQLGLFRHVLKVFLVDARGAVRNVYSAGFLSPELVLVDARTLLLESESGRGRLSRARSENAGVSP